MFKPSKYNYYVPYGEGIIFHNGISGSCFLMSKHEAEALKMCFENMQSFCDDHPADFERLKKMGYIVDEDFDETEYFYYRNKIETFSDRRYQIAINPTLSCNFRCWYCFESHYPGVMSKTTINRVKRHIRHKVESEHIPSLNINWFGGEPFLCFDNVVYPISLYAMRICKKNNIPCIVSATTNASLIDDTMLPKMNKIGLSSFQITIDGEREKHNSVRNSNGKPSYYLIINNIRKICDVIDNAFVSLRINYDETTFLSNNIMSILDEFEPEQRKHIEINLQKVWQCADQKTLSSKDSINSFIDCAHANGYRITVGGGINMRRCHSCYVSRINFININYDGLIYKCTARDYSKDNSVGELLSNGQINWDIGKVAHLYAVSPIDNHVCRDCKYLPLCGGPCVQKHIEKGFFCQYQDKSYFEDSIIRQYKNNVISFMANK